jgi:hypothetical protein
MQMTPKALALMTVALWCLGLPHQAQAATPSACGANFVPVLPAGTMQSFSDSLYLIGLNNSYSMPKCEPVTTARKKSALLLVPPAQKAKTGTPLIVASAMPETEIEPSLPETDLPAPVPEVISLVKPVPRPAVVEAPAPAPAPAPKPVQVQAELPAQVPDDDEGYSEPFAVAPVILGVGTAAVVTYALWEALDDKGDKNGEPARLTAGTEPVEALAAYDTKMLAAFAAINTVADLQSDQQISVGISSSVYNETPALAAGMSLRLGTQGILKTAISFSDNEYMANAGLSYGW